MFNKTLMGVDVNRQWQQYDGDLVLVDGTDNVAQSIFNRLTCRFNDMAYFYLNYGSHIKEWMGKPNYQQSWDSLVGEVKRTVLTDPRVSDCEVDVTPYDSYNIIINLNCIIDNSNVFVGNFILNTTNNSLNVYEGNKTYIKLALYRWTCKKKRIYQVRPNGTLRVLCKVLTPQDEGVPIGVVDFYINNHFIHSETVEKGKADFIYEVPYNVIEGKHVLTAHYRGLGSFGSSKEQIEFFVVNKLDTETRFKYDYLYAIAGRPVSFPATVKDINGDDVNSGILCYSLKVGGKWKLGTDLTISNMYMKYDEPRAVLQHSTLFDEFGDPVPCGRVCYYIQNGDGLLHATRNILSNAYRKEDSVLSLFHAQVFDENDNRVPFGKYCWWLRQTSGIPMETENTTQDTTAYHGFENEFVATVKDKDGYPVNSGIYCWYVRCMRDCKPFVTKTEITNVDVRNITTFIESKVKNRYDEPVPDGDVCYSYDDIALDLSSLPITFSTNNVDTSNLSPTGLHAMIVDKDGVVIDRGKFITQETDDGVVSTYFSTDDIVDDENVLKLELQEDKEDG